jgi:chromate transporter
MAAAAAGLILATAAKLAKGVLQGDARPAPSASARTGLSPASAEQGAEDKPDAEAGTRMARRIAQAVLLVMAFVGLGVLKLGLVTVVCALAPLGFVMFAFVWRLP